ncbi:MAG: HAD family hydrolase [Bacillales bacterium]|nr:HAD family hydrolase [Bacillales bacterium]
MLKAVFFDLDGTLLPLKEEDFVKVYFSSLAEKAAPFGYDSKKLITTIWGGTKKMMNNEGTKTNYEVFWQHFIEVYGKDRLIDKELIFDKFYKNEFYELKKVCFPNPLAKDIIAFCKDNLEKVVLSTNPIFPYEADVARCSFIDLDINDFDYVTTYENFSYCKPNPKYFIELLSKLNFSCEEVIVFGNNEVEDYLCAKEAGLTCYLVGDYIIKDDKELNIRAIKMEEVIPTIIKEIEKRK